LLGEHLQRVGEEVDGVRERGDLTLRVNGDLLREVTTGDGGDDLGDVADLAGQVGCHRVRSVERRVGSDGDTTHLGLTTEPAFGADLAGDTGDLVGERRELVDHRVDGALQLEDLALRIDGDLLAEVPLRDGGRDLSDVADLAGEVGCHRV